MYSMTLMIPAMSVAKHHLTVMDLVRFAGGRRSSNQASYQKDAINR